MPYGGHQSDVVRHLEAVSSLGEKTEEMTLRDPEFLSRVFDRLAAGVGRDRLGFARRTTSLASSAEEALVHSRPTRLRDTMRDTIVSQPGTGWHSTAQFEERELGWPMGVEPITFGTTIRFP